MLLRVLLKSLWARKILAWIGLFQFIKGDDSLRSIKFLYFLSDYNYCWRARLVDAVKSDDECNSVIKNNQVLTEFNNIEKLALLPAGSLGNLYAQFLIKNDIKPVQALNSKSFNDFHYIMHRFVTHHDIYHVVLGKDADFLGEAYVAGFTVAQFPAYTQASFIVGAGILRASAVDLMDMDKVFDAFKEGHNMGKQAKKFFPVNWDSLIHLDIDSIRNLLQVNSNQGD